MYTYYVYILASQKNGTLYVGVTNELAQRTSQHKQGTYDGFTKRYHVNRLVYYETFERIEDAIKREKQLKWWKRAWKVELIEKENPGWADLSEEWK